jgi:hypothetical protein
MPSPAPWRSAPHGHSCEDLTIVLTASAIAVKGETAMRTFLLGVVLASLLAVGTPQSTPGKTASAGADGTAAGGTVTIVVSCSRGRHAHAHSNGHHGRCKA